MEIGMNEEVLDILLPPRDEIVKTYDLVALCEEAVAKMRT
jgi:hypothetical protein